MEQNPLDEVTRRLRLPRRRTSAIARELESHVAEARRDLVLAGWKPEDARREAVARLGEPDELAAAFTHAYRPSRRSQLGLALALSMGMILGVYGIGGSFASAAHSRHPHAHHVQKTSHVPVGRPSR